MKIKNDKNLDSSPTCLCNDGIDPPIGKIPEPIWIDVKGREEHALAEEKAKNGQ